MAIMTSSCRNRDMTARSQWVALELASLALVGGVSVWSQACGGASTSPTYGDGPAAGATGSGTGTATGTGTGAGPSTSTGSGSPSGTAPGGGPAAGAGTSGGASGSGTGGGVSAGSGTGTATGTGIGTGTGSGSGFGGPISGTVGVTGGTVSRLYFASTGDTRPALPPFGINPTGDYPTAIIDQIFSDIAALSPAPSFVITTGDYQLATSASDSAAHLGLYMQARAKFPGTVFYGMGNHECSPLGVTTSNCGAGNADGLTANYTNFLSTMLAEIQQTKPYFVININATDGSWTSKFVYVAANAWDSTQESWLTAAMAVSTTYTFVIRHEPTDANTAPGVTPSEAIISQYPITLELCGHTHDYSHTGNRVVLGNGGAPLTGTGDYGYGVFQQRQDGAIVVDEVDYKTGATDPSFHFVVTPTGTITL